MENDLTFDERRHTLSEAEADGRKVKFHAFENMAYVKYPVNEQYQRMNLYVPLPYYEGGSIGGFTKETAPIFMPNTVGGYMPGAPERPGKNFMGMTNAAFVALERGYVVAAPGARGRGLTDEEGCFTGCAPACVVDIKAAIRYLRHNTAVIPGDTERIITNGTSAGGALSSLLGATGNHADYEEYLTRLGAAKERDDIFAASCYCPITNLEHADMAYEWMYGDLRDYHRKKFEMAGGEPKMSDVDGEMSGESVILSDTVRRLFPAYVNSLKLYAPDGTRLTLEPDGTGSFLGYVKSCVAASAQKALEQGTDLSGLAWLTVRDGRIADLDFWEYVRFATRMKETLAFDSQLRNTPENELFGNERIRFRHFTRFSAEHTKGNGELAENGQIKRMNPMEYIGKEGADCAKYWRIRHGAVDRDTAPAIPAILAVRLANCGCEVDFAAPWGVGHAGDYDLEELFDWVDGICKRAV